MIYFGTEIERNHENDTGGEKVMKNKVFKLVAMILVLALCFTACGKSSSSDTSSVNNSQTTEDSTAVPDTTEDEQESESEEEGDEETGETQNPDDSAEDADSEDSSDGQDAEEQAEVVEPYYSILVVSTGSASKESNDASIKAIEKAIGEQCPEYEIRRAFSNQDVVTQLNAQDISVDNVKDALDRCVADGVTHLAVQPTYLTDGEEYKALKQVVDQYKDKFEQVEFGFPLLHDSTDYDFIAGMLSNLAVDYDDGKTAFVYIGNEASDKMYTKIQKHLKSGWFYNCFVGSLNDDDSFEKVLKQVEKGGYKKIMLIPLMVSVDDDAMSQIAGKAEDTWKSMFQENGFKKVDSLNLGLGQIPGINDIYMMHISETAGAIY